LHTTPSAYATSGGGSKAKGRGITPLHKRSAEGGDTPWLREGRSSLVPGG